MGNASGVDKRVLLADSDILRIGAGGGQGFDQIDFDLGNSGNVMTLVNGRVGIGTTNPAENLTVHSNNPSGTSGIAIQRDNFFQNARLFLRTASNGHEWSIGEDTGSPGNALRFSENGALRMVINSGGDVGIGTSPLFKLDVAGPAHASSFPTSSDARLKTNIVLLSNVLEKLEKIRGVSFDWNEVYQSLGRSTGHREIGVVAQEVEAVFPELITTWSDQSYRAVDYGRLTGVLVEAVKELRTEKDAQITALKSESATWQQQITVLQQQNAALEARLATLEQAVRKSAVVAHPPQSHPRKAARVSSSSRNSRRLRDH